MLIALFALALAQTMPASGDGEDCNAESWTDACMDAMQVRIFEAADAGEACVGLQACLAVLDARGEDFHFEDLHAFGTKLLSFGQPARTALLDRVINDQSRLAFEVLDRDGVDWSDSDLNRLITAFEDGSDRRIVSLLANTGDARAERMLVDLALSDDRPAYEVRAAGARLFPHHWPEFLAAIERRLDRGGEVFDETLRFRLNQTSPEVAQAIARETGVEHARNHRIAAILLLMEMEEGVAPADEALLVLAEDPDRELANLARTALMQTGNATYAREIAEERCQTVEDDFSPYGNPQGSIAGVCPWNYFESSPAATEAAGPILLRLLQSSHPFQRDYVSRALTENGYEPAIPVYRTMLHSENWRDVELAIDALEEFEDSASISDLRSVSTSHWHPVIRLLAANAANQIEDVAGWVVPDVLLGRVGDSAAYALQAVCPGRLWSWRGEQLPHIVPQTSSPKDGESWIEERRLDLAYGYLAGTYEGEWLGELVWHPHHGEPEVLLADGVLALLPYRDGALVFTGSAHLVSDRGAVFRIEFSASGQPRVFRVAELPNAPYGGAAHFRDRLYAVSGAAEEETLDFVTVFDAEIGILGLADCVTD